jgi:molecular chaperone GrpE (heat shock protein)
MNDTIRIRIAADERRIKELKAENENYRKRIDDLRIYNPQTSSIKQLENCIKANLNLIDQLQKEIDYDKNRNDHNYTKEHTPSYNQEDYPSPCTRYDDEYPCTW